MTHGRKAQRFKNSEPVLAEGVPNQLGVAQLSSNKDRLHRLRKSFFYGYGFFFSPRRLNVSIGLRRMTFSVDIRFFVRSSPNS